MKSIFSIGLGSKVDSGIYMSQKKIICALTIMRGNLCLSVCLSFCMHISRTVHYGHYGHVLLRALRRCSVEFSAIRPCNVFNSNNL